jgi:hypothetical protein
MPNYLKMPKKQQIDSIALLHRSVQLHVHACCRTDQVLFAALRCTVNARAPVPVEFRQSMFCQHPVEALGTIESAHS